MTLDPNNPLPFGTPGDKVTVRERRQQLDLLRDLNGLTAIEYPDDAKLQARIKAYELAFRMQMSVPEIVDLNRETQACKSCTA